MEKSQATWEKLIQTGVVSVKSDNRTILITADCLANIDANKTAILGAIQNYSNFTLKMFCHYCENKQIQELTNNQTILNATASLSLSKSNATDEIMPEIAKFTNLKELNLDWTQITNEGLKILTQNKAFVEKLTSLSLYANNNVTDETMQTITQFTNLKELDLGFTRITNEGLKILARNKAFAEKLTYLSLYDCNITKEWIPTLANFTKLKDLVLGYCSDPLNGLKDRLPDALIRR
jgi:Leucine Rich Repeat.